MSYKIIQLEQGTTPWLDYRKSKISATDTAKIMNLNPWVTAYNLWQEKLGLIQPEPENDAMREGSRMEKEARLFYNEENKTEFKPVVLESNLYPFMTASLDGFNGSMVLEIKCGKVSHESAKKGELPAYYYAQCQKQMLVSGASRCHYFSYRSKEDNVTIILERDDAFIEKIIEAEKQFFKCLMDFTPPTLCDRDYEIRSDRAWEILSETWRHKKKELDRVKEEEEALRLELIAQAGGKSTKGARVVLTKYMKRGQINFMSIPEIMSMDKERLESYRKANAECYRITSSEEK
jgi:putative phage-type endonuclease